MRRAAAQAVGLLGQLLGDTYASHFFAIATGALADPSTKDESRAAHALALGQLVSSPLAGRASPDKAAAMGRVRACVQVLCGLAFTRYCFTSRLMCMNQSSFTPPPARPHGPHYYTTVARRLRNIRPRTDPPPLCMSYTIQYW